MLTKTKPNVTFQASLQGVEIEHIEHRYNRVDKQAKKLYLRNTLTLSFIHTLVNTNTIMFITCRRLH